MNADDEFCSSLYTVLGVGETQHKLCADAVLRNQIFYPTKNAHKVRRSPGGECNAKPKFSVAHLIHSYTTHRPPVCGIKRSQYYAKNTYKNKLFGQLLKIYAIRINLMHKVHSFKRVSRESIAFFYR